MLKALQSQMKRAALSEESTISTPPLTLGWLATMPTARPPMRARPTMISRREEPLDLEERARVDDAVDHLVHVEPLALVVGHDLLDGAAGLRLGAASRAAGRSRNEPGM